MGIKKSVLSLLGVGGDTASKPKSKKSKSDKNYKQPSSVEGFLENLGTYLGYDIGFEKTEEDNQINFNLVGVDSEDLMGKDAELLDALTHISMRIQRRVLGLSNQPSGEGESLKRIRFDSNGFRDKRKESLVDLGKKLRAKVIDSGKAAYVSALGPSDRKIVHTTISGLGDDVVTESIGKGHFKRIRVKFAQGKGPRRNDRGDSRRPHRNSNGGGADRQDGNSVGRAEPRAGTNGLRSNQFGSNNSRGRGRARLHAEAAGVFGAKDPVIPTGVEDNFGNRARPKTEDDTPKADENIGNKARPGDESSHYFDGDSN